MNFKTLEHTIKLTFISDILGTAPSQELLQKEFFQKKQEEVKEQIENILEEAKELAKESYTEEDYDTPENEEISGMTYFRRDKNGIIYIPNFMVKGFFKSAAQALKDQLSLKAYKKKIDCFLFVFPNHIHFYRNGELIKEPDDIYVRPLRGMTRQGERVTLVASERIKASEENPVTTNEIKLVLIENKELTFEKIKSMLDYGFLLGISQFRNGGFGRFKWELIDGGVTIKSNGKVKLKVRKK